MTFLELCKAARQESGIQGDGPATVITQVGLLKRVVEWVRDADLYIKELHPDWDFKWAEYRQNTTTGSRDLPRPADLGMWDQELFAVNYGTTDATELEVVDFQEFKRNIGYLDMDYPGGICVLPNGNLSLDYPADGTYEIYGNYWKSSTALALDADVSAIPASFHRMIVIKAKMYFFEDIESFDQYKAAEKEFDEWLVRLEAKQLPEMKKMGQMSPAAMTVRPE